MMMPVELLNFELGETYVHNVSKDLKIVCLDGTIRPTRVACDRNAPLLCVGMLVEHPVSAVLLTTSIHGEAVEVVVRDYPATFSRFKKLVEPPSGQPVLRGGTHLYPGYFKPWLKVNDLLTNPF